MGAIAGFGRERWVARRGCVVTRQDGARQGADEYEVSHESASSCVGVRSPLGEHGAHPRTPEPDGRGAHRC